jgi:hypothetical protein
VKNYPAAIRTAAERARALDWRKVPAIARQVHGRSRDWRREIGIAMADLAGAMYESADQATMRLGPRDSAGVWRARGLAELTKASGLKQRKRNLRGVMRTNPARRTERAMQIFQRAGFVMTLERREHKLEGWRSQNAIRAITAGMNRAIEMEIQFDRAQHWAIKQLRKQRPRAAAHAAAAMAPALQKSKGQQVFAYGMRSIADVKAFNAICAAIRAASADWIPADEVKRLAMEQWSQRAR